MIDLYNSVLDHTTLVLTSPALQDISWPAPELQHAAAKLDGKAGFSFQSLNPEFCLEFRRERFHSADMLIADLGARFEMPENNSYRNTSRQPPLRNNAHKNISI